MNYTLHSEPQGSDEWKAGRDGRNNASELVLAAGETMNGRTRTDLIRKMATGIEPEIDAATQKRYDDGHRYEALARPLAEKIIGRDLYPITISMQVAGLKRPLGASLDGATDDDSENFEHKGLSAELRSAMVRGFIPPEYHWQMEEGQMINGATRTLFMASKWDDDNNLLEELHLWYESNPELRAKIIPIWKQLESDVENYQHVEAAPEVVAAPINELPALMVEITGSVTASNLADWKAIVTERIAGINTDLQTDTDFANADAMVKFLDDGEKRIDLVKSQAQANAADIDRVFRALDEIKASMRAKRLELDKLVKARKENIRGEIAREGLAKLNNHVDALNKRLGRKLIQPAGDFHAAIKGKRTVQSLRDACDSELARAKIAASEQADRIQINLSAYADIAAGHEFLFRDLDALVLKDADGFSAIVQQRIDAHKKQEADRLEAERANIRAQEEARAAAKVKDEQAEEHALIDGLWRNARRIEGGSAEYIQKAINAFESMAPDWENDPRPNVAAAVAAARKEMQDKLSAAKARAEQEEAERQRKVGEEAAEKIKNDAAIRTIETLGSGTEPATQPAAPPTAAAIGGYTGAPAVVAAIDNGRYLRLGEINSLLGFTVSSDFLAGLGFVATQDKNAKLYRECDFPAICRAIVEHIGFVASVPAGMRKAA